MTLYKQHKPQEIFSKHLVSFTFLLKELNKKQEEDSKIREMNKQKMTSSQKFSAFSFSKMFVVNDMKKCLTSCNNCNTRLTS